MERRRRITLTASLIVGLVLMAWFGHALAQAGRSAPETPPHPTVSWTIDDRTERVVLADDATYGRGGSVR